MKFMMDIREKTSLLHSAAENTGYIKASGWNSFRRWIC